MPITVGGSAVDQPYLDGRHPAGSASQSGRPFTVVFIQAPADVAYALALCEQAEARHGPVLLVVVNVKSLYDYLVTVRLPVAGIHFIPYLLQPLPVLPWKVWCLKARLSQIRRQLFKGKDIGAVYFFSRHSDAVTPYFLRRFSRGTRVFLADHYHLQYGPGPRWTPRLLLKWL